MCHDSEVSRRSKPRSNIFRRLLRSQGKFCFVTYCRNCVSPVRNVLLRKLESHAREIGLPAIRLSSTTTVKAFYLRNRFTPCGPPDVAFGVTAFPLMKELGEYANIAFRFTIIRCRTPISRSCDGEKENAGRSKCRARVSYSAVFKSFRVTDRNDL